MQNIYLFDWGDTLMVDIPGMAGKMCDWPHVEAVPFAAEALESISAGASIYIATAAADSTTEDIAAAFDRVGLHVYIQGYFCRQNTGFTKPAPEFYLEITRQLAVNPGQATMVGDSLEKDILPCHELGFNTIWLNAGNERNVPEGIRIIGNLGQLCASQT